ncbi:tRNA lysidine(34) synthetase TilS [uncultured Thiohalocapsa sp.]|uniref:tRNA lysidine(34) synthetase TilS n=1 Tax=uncultured Thiohalocapsa sp. TaxID=768990 RepID=UPI0025CEA7D6|nr:tRNA lysidine(34) synthetase TilS [uncultured Thiohalocapsa sp.]
MRPADQLTDARLAAALAPAAGGRLWIAYSGGLDSHGLLHAAARLRVPLRLDLAAVHVHHGLQPAADAWVAHCQRVCAALGIPLKVLQLGLQPTAGESPEAAAREARYGAFGALLQPGEALATAQHRDDQAETLLLALLRGAGPHGLAAMPARARLGAGTLLRPLLELPRAAILDYARAHGLKWVEDPSNADAALDRNRLRHRVIPRLRERWPALDRTLARSAAHCAEAAALLDELADALLKGLGAAGDTGDVLPRALSMAGLRRLSGPRQRLVLRRWLLRLDFPVPDADRLRRITTEVLEAGADRQPLVAWPGCEVRRHRDALYALSPLPEPPAPGSCLLPLPGAASLSLPPPLGTLRWVLHDAAMPAQVRVCFGVPGLRCARPGRPAADLKTLFQEAGVPAWLRPQVPLLCLDSALAGVGGVRLCGTGLKQLIWEGHPWGRQGWLSPVVDLTRGGGR